MQPDNAPHQLAVLGAGSWGTAIALTVATGGHPCRLWTHEPSHAQRLESDRSNADFLPGYPFPDALSITNNLEDAVSGQTDLIIAVPSFAFRETLVACKPHIAPGSRVAWATKGFEPGTGKLLHEVVEDELGKDISHAILSGPSFALEVAKQLPTAITVASNNPTFAADLAERLHTDTFRVYTSDDVTGVELGGAVKNVLAIAAGIADGLGFGANTRAALITRGLTEIMRLGKAMVCQPETLMGLAGLGDLALTCTDDQSRNRRMGLQLAKGIDNQTALNSIGQTVEGFDTAKEVHMLAQRHHVEMPICEKVYQVLYEGLAPKQAVIALLRRDQKSESS